MISSSTRGMLPALSFSLSLSIFIRSSSLSISLAHHHLAELVKVHGAGAVLVDLLDDAVEVLFRESGVQLSDDLPKLGCYSVVT